MRTKRAENLPHRNYAYQLIISRRICRNCTHPRDKHMGPGLQCPFKPTYFKALRDAGQPIDYKVMRKYCTVHRKLEGVSNKTCDFCGNE